MINDIKQLLGRRVGFCGVDNHTFCFDIDGEKVAFEAVENPDDGYRSMMEDVKTVPVEGGVYHKRPFAEVVVEEYEGLPPGSMDMPDERFEGYVLIDADDPSHVWLTFGTHWLDNYYPIFYFEYTPKQGTVLASFFIASLSFLGRAGFSAQFFLIDKM